MDGTSFSTNCTNITADQLEARNFSRTISAMVCTVITFAVLLVLILTKAYKTTLQRLFLSLTTIVLIQLILISMSIELQFTFKQREDMCVILAFLTVWTALITYLFAVGVTLFLLFLVFKQLRADKSYVQVQQNTKCRLIFEISLILFCIVSPLTYLWVPFYHGTYGDALVSCWIINTKLDCNYIGFEDQAGLSFGIFYATCFVIVVGFAGIVVLFCVFAAKYKLTRRQHLKTICKTLILVIFITASALIEVLGLVQFIYNTISGKHLPFGVSVVYEGAIPFSQMIIPLGFLVYSLKKVKCRKKPKCCLCCAGGRKKRSVRFQNDQVQTTVVQVTAPASTRVEAPSDTYFNVPYTGEFTSVTDPLISNRDTGYGSVADNAIENA